MITFKEWLEELDQSGVTVSEIDEETVGYMSVAWQARADRAGLTEDQRWRVSEVRLDWQHKPRGESMEDDAVLDLLDIVEQLAGDPPELPEGSLSDDRDPGVMDPPTITQELGICSLCGEDVAACRCRQNGGRLHVVAVDP